ncbi:hypothetical protein [Variovorax paradoxus]|uniref:hypothetical protein n=1 Tax=Variovorax paradoxus TaxID=34073 RepID=UPI003D645EE2
MQYPHTLLLAALRDAPRRYCMPPLPADAEAAAASGTDAALAFAIDAARVAGEERNTPLPAEAGPLFTRALAQLIQKSLAREGGDPAFQALVMQAQDAAVNEHAQLWRLRDADQRAVRAAINAFAHPGKLRGMPEGELRDALAQLHELAASGLWEELAQGIKKLLDQKLPAEKSLQPALRAILSGPSLDRLARSNELLHLEAVQRYQALVERQGPAAGSDAALSKGRASARRGEAAEEASTLALGKIADLLNRHDKGNASYRVVRSLRNPPAFPGEANKAKEEWDAAIVRGGADATAELVLLAEIKASPAAATADFSRLLRGLRRLAEAGAEETYAFASADGLTRIHGTSLQRLLPDGDSLPPHVIYCCSAAPEARPPMLSAASKAVLLAEPASLAFAHRLLAGAEAPPPDSLAAVWQALMTEPRLRAALHQYDTARKARAAMLHPADLLASAARQFDEAPGASDNRR